MERLNPFFEVEGKRYEIKRTRFLESEYEKITNQTSLSEQDERLYAEYIKLETECAEIGERYKNAREDYFNDITNDEKKKKYEAFKTLSDEKYNEVIEFGFKHKDFSTKKLEDKALENGIKLFVIALQEQYKISELDSKNIWEKFKEYLLENFGINSPREWILHMVNTLFEVEEENEDPFLKQAKAKAMQKAEQRKGLSKMKK